MNTLSGFILVRAMAKQDYAWFTIALAAVSTINVLADSGLGSALNAVGGPLVSNTRRFASLTRLVRQRRAVYGAAAALVVLPITFGLLHANEARLGTSVLILALVALTAVASTEAVVYVATHKLRSRVRPLLRSEIAGSGVRLVLILAAAGFGIGVAIAVACSSLAQWVRLLLLRRQTTDLSTTDDYHSDTWRRQINGIVLHSLPLALFYCVQGVVATVVLSVFATSSQVADLGALTRFHIVFAIVAMPLAHFVFPGISRCPEGVGLRRIVLRTIAGASAVFTGLALLGVVCRPVLLWLLGPQYAHLGGELALYLATLAIASCASMMWGILLARGWVRHGWIQIPLAIALMVLSTSWLEFDKTSSAIVFAALGSVASLCTAGILVARSLPSGAAESLTCGHAAE